MLDEYAPQGDMFCCLYVSCFELCQLERHYLPWIALLPFSAKTANVLPGCALQATSLPRRDCPFVEFEEGSVFAHWLRAWWPAAELFCVRAAHRIYIRRYYIPRSARYYVCKKLPTTRKCMVECNHSSTQQEKCGRPLFTCEYLHQKSSLLNDKVNGKGHAVELQEDFVFPLSFCFVSQ